MRQRWLILLVIIMTVLIIDQVTKRIVVDTMALYQTSRPIPALAPFFQITRTENTGSAFGFLPQAGDVFLVIALVVVAALIYFYPRIPTWPSRVAVGLICGGALGNAFDRIQHGVVVDFIHFQVGSISNVSNLADHAIVLGVIIILLDSWRSERKAPPLAAPDEDAPADRV